MGTAAGRKTVQAVLIVGLLWTFTDIGSCAHAQDGAWARAMLKARREYRENGVRGPALRRRIKQAVTGQVFERLLAEYPYRTDWLLQDCGNDLEPWLQQRGAAKIERALLRQLGVIDIPDGGTEDPRWLERFAAAAESRRARRLRNLQTRYREIVFTKNHTVSPSFFAYTEGQSDAQHERHFTPGTALCKLLWDGAYARVVNLIDDPFGRIRDPEVSFDGKRVLFAWKKSNWLSDYHLHELSIETGQVRQLTFGLGVADFEPCYVPSGDIVFSSSRCVQTVDCWLTEVSNLYTCGPDGEHLRRLGYDQVHTVKPALLPSGKVIYTRWDYNDRGQVWPQGLFEMNPDGTAQTEYYGNNSWFPTTLCHARGIEGSDKVVAVAMGHHTWQAGKLVLIDIAKGRQEESGVQLIAPMRATNAVHVDAFGQQGDLIQYPYALNEREYLVAYSPLGGRPSRFSIYYMDIDGNRELLVSDPEISCQHPVPLAPRRRPATRPSVVDYSRDTATYYVQDVYRGAALQGVARGTIKKLRVVQIDFRAAAVGANYNKGPGGGALISTPVAVGNGCWDVKRVLGDATVHKDGSALFEVPARVPVYFQCLDENNRAVQTMRSWSTLQPGETFSCVGCHEPKNTAAPPAPTTLAYVTGKERLKPFYGQTRGFSFQKEVQPILDAKCVTCHDGSQQDRIDLSAKPVLDRWAKRRWSAAYINLTGSSPAREENSQFGLGAFRGDDGNGHVRWVSSQSAPKLMAPRTAGSTVSPLVDMLLEGHGELNREELDKIIAWIDLGVPFCGDYREAAAWTNAEMDLYDRYAAKRLRLNSLAEQNIKALLRRDHSAPQGSNLYRNIAPEARVSTNSVCRGNEAFAAYNVVDGRRENTGHGARFPSWGPERRDAIWLQFNWTEPVFTDRINLYIRADFADGHDSWWKSGTCELSTGQKIAFQLVKTRDVQVVQIPIQRWPPRPLRWLKIANLVPHEDKWCGFTEVEIMGRTAKKGSGAFLAN